MTLQSPGIVGYRLTLSACSQYSDNERLAKNTTRGGRSSRLLREIRHTSTNLLISSPMIDQGSADHEMLSSMPHWDRPQGTTTIAAEDLVLVATTKCVLQQVAFKHIFTRVHFHLSFLEFGYLSLCYHGSRDVIISISAETNIPVELGHLRFWHSGRKSIQ